MSLLERGFSGYAGTVTDWYAYNPVVGAAVAATALYAVVLVTQTWQMIRHKAWIWFVMVVAVASMLCTQSTCSLFPTLEDPITDIRFLFHRL